MIQDGTVVCDNCKAKITRVVDLPTDDWQRLHNLCATCFASRAASAV
ncbi:MAG TPA: hypothetical protein VGV89_03630 [Thermoplasmata archaeon]|nr:hypothetical protein [Thermoplasmata archaeon]